MKKAVVASPAAAIANHHGLKERSNEGPTEIGRQGRAGAGRNRPVEAGFFCAATAATNRKYVLKGGALMEQDSAKRRLIQRRAAWVTGLLAVGVLAVSGFAFLQSNGTVTATVSAASTSAGEVYTSNPAAPPANFPTLWYCGTLTGSTGTASINSSCQAGTQTSGPVAPAWSAVVNSQGGVTGAGDVAIVDACDYNSGSSACNWTTSNTVLLTVGWMLV